MNIAIIGANGFVGARLAQSFVTGGHKIWAFCRSQTGNVPPGCVLVSADIPLQPQVEFDIVYVTIGNYALTSEQFQDQHNFLEKWLSENKYRRVVYVSSVAVYGNHAGPVSIGSLPRDPGLYGASKLKEEELVMQCPSYAIARFTYLYGIGMGPASFIPRITRDAISRHEVTLFGKGLREQDYLHIDDAVKLLEELGKSTANGIALGVSGESRSNLEAATCIADAVGGVTIAFQGEDTASSVKFNLPENTWYSWKPKVGFSSGIQQYVAHEMAHLQ